MRGHRRTSSAILLLIMVFFVSLLVLTCAAPYDHDQLLKVSRVQVADALTFSAFSVFSGRSYNEVSTLLNQTTRMDIYNFVKDNPGLHFRALSNRLSMPIGVLQYHLGLLVNGGLLSSYRDERYRRYFESKRFTEAEMKVISVLRHVTSGNILAALLKRPRTTHKDLAKELSISSQALSWQMHRLEKMGFVKREVESVNVRYSLDETFCATVGRCATLLELKTC